MIYQHLRQSLVLVKFFDSDNQFLRCCLISLCRLHLLLASSLRIFLTSAGRLLNRLIECRTGDSDSRDVLGWDVKWAELESPRYVIFQPLDSISACLLERDGKEFFHDDTPGPSDVPEGHISVKVLIELDPCILARVQMLENRVAVLERAEGRRESNEVGEGNNEGDECNEGRKRQRR